MPPGGVHGPGCSADERRLAAVTHAAGHGVRRGRAVERREVQLGLLRHRHAAESVLGQQDLVPDPLQAEAEEPPDVRFVIDHQHAGHARTASFPCPRRAGLSIPSGASADDAASWIPDHEEVPEKNLARAGDVRVDVLGGPP